VSRARAALAHQALGAGADEDRAAGREPEAGARRLPAPQLGDQAGGVDRLGQLDHPGAGRHHLAQRAGRDRGGRGQDDRAPGVGAGVALGPAAARSAPGTASPGAPASSASSAWIAAASASSRAGAHRISSARSPTRSVGPARQDEAGVAEPGPGPAVRAAGREREAAEPAGRRRCVDRDGAAVEGGGGGGDRREALGAAGGQDRGPPQAGPGLGAVAILPHHGVGIAAQERRRRGHRRRHRQAHQRLVRKPDSALEAGRQRRGGRGRHRLGRAAARLQRRGGHAASPGAVPTNRLHTPKVRGTTATSTRPAARIIAANSSGGGKAAIEVWR
jgi:hypothetical protein